MTWNPSLIDGPLSVPLYGPPDPETGDRPIIGVRPGYRINVARSVVTAEAEAFELDPEPSHPFRVFAGDARGEDGRHALTAFLLFDDEDQARAVLPALWVEPDLEPDVEPVDE